MPLANAKPPTATPTNQQTWNSNAAGGIAGTLASQILPAYLQNAYQAQGAGEQMALAEPLYDWQSQYQQQQYGYQQQGFGVEQAGLGLQRQQLGREQSHLAAGYGFQQQQDVLSGQSIAENIQQALAQYGVQQQQFGLQRQQLGVQQGQLNLAETQGKQGLGAAGTLTSAGARGQMEQGFGYQQQLLDISKRGESLQEKQAKLTQQHTMFGLEQQRKQLGLTEAEQKEQYGYSTQQIQDGMQQLNLQQRSLGISEAQANSQYTNALQQLGLSNVMNVQQLKDQLAALAGGGYSPIASMMGKLTDLLPFLGGIYTQPQGG